MSISYGFYNSLDHDRLYNARQVSQIFDGLIENGVYETIGGALMVQPGSGMTVNVQPGRAWFDHTWTYNDSIYPLTLEDSDPIVSRYDGIVLEIDTRRDVRVNSIKILKGTPTTTNPQKPELTNDSYIHQYPLAWIFVGPDVSAITASDIENCVGTNATPFVIGVVSSMSAEWLYAQWAQKYNDWFDQSKKKWDDYTDYCEDDWIAWRDQSSEEFNEWFAGLHYILDGDVAGHLQEEIDHTNEHLDNVEDQLNSTWPVVFVPYTLKADGWDKTTFTYSIESDFPVSDYNIVGIDIPQDITENEMDALRGANIYGYNETNIITGHGYNIPTIDIPVIFKVSKKGGTVL